MPQRRSFVHVASRHSRGGQATYEAFIEQASAQSKLNWREQYTAAAVNAYIRAGFETH